MRREGFRRRYAKQAADEPSDRKNDLLDFICQDSGLQPVDIRFFDDGPGNVKGAERFGVKCATLVNFPADLTNGLNIFLKELGMEPVPVEPLAAQAVKAEEPVAVASNITGLRLDQLLMMILTSDKRKPFDKHILRQLQRAVESEGGVELARLCEVFVGLHDLATKYGTPTQQSTQSAVVRVNKANMCQSLLKTLRRMIGEYGQGDKFEREKILLEEKLKAIYDNPDQQAILFAGNNSQFKVLVDKLNNLVGNSLSPDGVSADSTRPPVGGK